MELGDPPRGLLELGKLMSDSPGFGGARFSERPMMTHVLCHFCLRFVLFIGLEGMERKLAISRILQDFGSSTWPDLLQAKAFLKTIPCCRDEHQLMALLVSRVTGREHEHGSVGTYPLVISHSCGKSPFSMGKATINGHFQ